MAVSYKDQSRMSESDDLAVGNQLRDAATRYHQDERGHDRLNNEYPHEQTVPASREQRHAEGAGQYGSQRQMARVSQLGSHRSGDRHDCADGQVHSTSGYDERHSERNQHYPRAVVQDINERAVQIALPEFDVKKAGRKKEVEEQQQTEARNRPDQAAPPVNRGLFETLRLHVGVPQ